MSGSPNIVIRMAYLAALVLPLIKNVSMYPVVVLCAFCISKHTFAYPFMPTEMPYYEALSLAFAFIVLSKHGFKSMINPLFIVILVYLAIDEVILQGYISLLVIHLFVLILFYFISEENIGNCSKHLQWVFIILSLALSYWILFCPEARINTYNSVGDMEQVGWRDPNYLGCALGMGLVIAIKELLLGVRTKYYTYILIVTVIMSSIALLGLASRGMTVAVAICVVLLLFFSKTKSRTKVLAIVGIVAFMVFLYTNKYVDFVIARFNADNGTGSGRTILWVSRLSSFAEEGNLLKWLFGFGIEQGCRLGLKGTMMANHNDFVAILVYYGFTGLFLFICALIYPLRKCSNRIKPTIAVFIIYLVVCSMSIEPLSAGNIAYMGFYFYLTQIARQSRIIKEDYE